MYKIQEFTVKPDKIQEFTVNLTVKVKFTVNLTVISYAYTESCKVIFYSETYFG